MASSSTIHLVLLPFLLFTGVVSAFNATKVLGPLHQFSTFSNYLAQVGVVSMMADLNNVTILAVDNANMGPIAGKSRDEIKRVMTMHVIPEYYDLERLRTLPNGTALIRTVYVLTGLARGKDGMLLVTKRGKGGRLSFASAILPRSKPTVSLLRSVVVPSRNVSIFHVSGVIATPPPVVSVASEGAGFDRAGGIAVSEKLMVRRVVPKEAAAAVKGGIKVGDLNEVFMPKTWKSDGDDEEEDLKTSEKAEEKAPAKAPAKSTAAPKKSPAKAPAPSKSGSGGKKGKSPAKAPAPSSDSPAPAPAKKKSDGPSPAASEDAPPKSPAASKSPKAAKSSEPAPADSTSGDAPAPAKSGKGGGSSSSDSPASSSAPSPDESSSNPSPPAPAAKSDAPAAESPAEEAEAPAPAGGAAPMTVTNVGIMMTVMALWALAA